METPADTIQLATNGAGSETAVAYDPFSMSNLAQAVPATPYNPYLEDTTSIANNGTAFFPAQAGFTAPTQPVRILPVLSALAKTSSCNITSTRQSALTRRIS